MPGEIETAATYTLLGSLVLAFVLNGLANQILSCVLNVSLILHMFLVKLNYPAQMTNFFSLLFPMITFDLIPTSWLYEMIFKFEEIETDYALSDQFETIGYGSIFIVNNIGSMYLMWTLWILMLIVTVIIKKFKIFAKYKRLHRMINNYYQANFWNGILDACFSGYLVLAVASFTESNDIRIKGSYSSTEIYNSLLAIIVMAFTVAFPFVLMCVMYFKQKK
jgi:hypothetical protein